MTAPLTIDVRYDADFGQYVAEDVIDQGDSIRGFGLTRKTALLNLASQLPDVEPEPEPDVEPEPGPESYYMVDKDGDAWLWNGQKWLCGSEYFPDVIGEGLPPEYSIERLIGWDPVETKERLR